LRAVTVDPLLVTVEFQDWLTVWPLAKVQVTVQPVIAEEPALTRTSPWKPPVHWLVIAYAAEQVRPGLGGVVGFGGGVVGSGGGVVGFGGGVVGFGGGVVGLGGGVVGVTGPPQAVLESSQVARWFSQVRICWT
jgi:hypothetical protein